MTPLLLDTYTLVGAVSEGRRLSARARELILDPANEMFVSAISVYEIGTAVQKRRLDLALPPRAWFARALSEYSIRPVEVTWEIAAAAMELPGIHWDPGDRLIIATAVTRDLTLLTPDRDIQRYPGVKLAW
jgi:PIN domain nuclease of toxin-antitoxin system